MHDLTCVPVEYHKPRHQHLGWAWNNVKPPETKLISRVASSSPVEQTYEFGNQSEIKAAMRMAISFVFLASVLLGGSILTNAADVTTTETSQTDAEKSSGWKLLFDGTTLKGLKISENPESFMVRDGMIVARGRGTAIKEQAPHPKCHLFYVGQDGEASFKDFEFQADIKTEHLANSGIYFHTAFVADAWPQKGFEIQIDNDPTHPKKDWKSVCGP